MYVLSELESKFATLVRMKFARNAQTALLRTGHKVIYVTTDDMLKIGNSLICPPINMSEWLHNRHSERLQ